MKQQLARFYHLQAVDYNQIVFAESIYQVHERKRPRYTYQAKV